jgi:hypothetical protein
VLLGIVAYNICLFVGAKIFYVSVNACVSSSPVLAVFVILIRVPGNGRRSGMR